MIQKLDEESRKNLVKYRLEKSDNAMKEAKLMASNGFFDSAVTRLYYACFYIACALLIKHGIETGSHRGVKTMLSLNFVKNGVLGVNHIKAYTDLLNGRQLNDYEDFYYQDKESYETYLKNSIDFINAVKNLL